jgi:hypothetical protein
MLKTIAFRLKKLLLSILLVVIDNVYLYAHARKQRLLLLLLFLLLLFLLLLYLLLFVLLLRLLFRDRT